VLDHASAIAAWQQPDTLALICFLDRDQMIERLDAIDAEADDKSALTHEAREKQAATVFEGSARNRKAGSGVRVPGLKAGKLMIWSSTRTSPSVELAFQCFLSRRMDGGRCQEVYHAHLTVRLYRPCRVSGNFPRRRQQINRSRCPRLKLIAAMLEMARNRCAEI